MSDLFGTHIVGFPTRRLICFPCTSSLLNVVVSYYVFTGWGGGGEEANNFLIS